MSFFIQCSYIHRRRRRRLRRRICWSRFCRQDFVLNAKYTWAEAAITRHHKMNRFQRSHRHFIYSDRYVCLIYTQNDVHIYLVKRGIRKVSINENRVDFGKSSTAHSVHIWFAKTMKTKKIPNRSVNMKRHYNCATSTKKPKLYEHRTPNTYFA